jgi:outer membrane protein OmpA-like peptidoglycan-associated protein
MKYGSFLGFGILFSMLSLHVMAQDEVEYELVNLGRKVNSIYHDSSPIVTPDGNTLYFTITNHPENTYGSENSQDIWCSRRDENGEWSEAFHMEKPFNTEQYNQVQSVSADGQLLLIRGGKRKKSPGFSLVSKAGGEWQKPVPQEIEDFEDMCKGHFNGAFLAYDRQVMLLYFSERPKSKYSDLYVSFRQAANEWSRPRLISCLNTHMDEFGPYLAPDNKTLYFASNRGGGMGKMDVYKTIRQDDSWLNWSKPENIGAPVNTDGFDAYYAIGNNDTLVFTTRAYMSADGGHLDIFSLRRIKKDPPKIFLAGAVVDEKTWKPIDASVRYILEEEVKGVMGTREEDGGFETGLNEAGFYKLEVSAEGYFSKTDSFRLAEVAHDTTLYRDIMLKPIEVGISVRLNNIFFDYDKATLRPESFPELDKVVEFMQENPNLHIEIGGHTDDRGSDEYNRQLSQGRAESVRAYLLEKWIDPERVSARGYGESKPEVTNDSDENRQINRRVEFTILKN